jgi:hypothetical protein
VSLSDPLKIRAILVAGLVALIALIVWATSGDSGKQRRIWYFDLNTGKLYVPAELGDQPQKAPSGDLRDAPAGTLAGVAAVVVRIASAAPEPIYLQRTPLLEITATVELTAPAADKGSPSYLMQRTEVAALPTTLGTQPQWHLLGTPAGQEIVRNAQQRLRDTAWDNDLP